jgi:hypothetical protein
MNLFALTRDSSRRILRIPLSAEVQSEVSSTFSGQEEYFRKSCEERIDFDGKYKPDEGECLLIADFDDIDGLHSAVANPLSVPEIEPATTEFETIKALFAGKIDGEKRITLIQSFDKRKIISNKGLSIFHSANVFRKVEGVGLTLDTKLAAILEDKDLSFFSFHAARQIFDLTQYYKEATDEDLNEFAASSFVKIEDLPNFILMSDTWIRRKVSLVMQSGILEKVQLETTKQAALIFGIDIQTEANNGNVALVLPKNKADLKKVLRFLDEDYFQSVLSSTLHLSNSKRQISVSE